MGDRLGERLEQLERRRSSTIPRHDLVDAAVVDRSPRGRRRRRPAAGRDASSTSTSNGCGFALLLVVVRRGGPGSACSRGRSGRSRRTSGGGLACQVPRTIASLIRAARTLARDVVDADDVDARGDPERGRGERRLEPLVGRQVEDLAEGRLARRARAGSAGRGRAARRARAGARGCARRSCRSRSPGRRSGRPGRRRARSARSIAARRSAMTSATQVGVARLGAVVHDDERDAVGRRRARASAVVRPDAPDVVDQVGAGVEGRLGDGRLGRVDADRGVGEGGADGRDDRDDPRGSLLGRRRPGRGRAGSTRRRCRGGRRPRRPSGAARRRSTGSGRRRSSGRAGRRAARRRRTSPGVTLRMPITNVRAPQRERRAADPGRRGVGRVDGRGGHRASGCRRRGRAGRDRRRGGRGPPRRDRASRRRRPGRRPSASASSSAATGSGGRHRSRLARPGRGPARGELGRPAAPAATSTAVATTVAPASAPARRERRDRRRRRPCPPSSAVTSVSGPAARNGRRSSSAAASAAAPAGLWAPSSRTSRPSTREQLEPAGPDRARRSRDRRAASVDRRDPGRLERVEQRVGDRHVGGLVAAAQPDAGRPERRQLDVDAVAIPAEERRRRDLGQRHAEPPRAAPDDRQRLAGRRRSRPGRRAR